MLCCTVHCEHTHPTCFLMFLSFQTCVIAAYVEDNLGQTTHFLRLSKIALAGWEMGRVGTFMIYSQHMFTNVCKAGEPKHTKQPKAFLLPGLPSCLNRQESRHCPTHAEKNELNLTSFQVCTSIFKISEGFLLHLTQPNPI